MHRHGFGKSSIWFGYTSRVLGWCCALIVIAVAQVTANAKAQSSNEEKLSRHKADAIQVVIGTKMPEGSCRVPVARRDRCIWRDLAYVVAVRTAALAGAKAPNGLQAQRVEDGVIDALESAYLGQDVLMKGASSDPSDFYFLTATLAFRLDRLLAAWPDRASARRRLSNVFRRWAETACAVSDAQYERSPGTVHVWKTENHSFQRAHGCWAAAVIASEDRSVETQKYDDASTPSQQKYEWELALIYSIRSRGRAGGLIEAFSPTYSLYTLSTLYNIYDFADGDVLRTSAKALLDLWWAEWAQEQIGGFHGGPLVRSYPSRGQHGLVGVDLGYIEFGLGLPNSVLRHPGNVIAAASRYVPPSAIRRLALEGDRGSYEVWSRRIGAAAPQSRNEWAELQSKVGDLLRYTYVSPSFIMGTNIVPVRNAAYWNGISSQNRHSGVVLPGNGGAKIFAAPEALNGRTTYNSTWGIQLAGTQIIQRLDVPFSRGAGRMRVWLGGDLPRREINGWAIVSAASAFVGVRPAWGGFSIDKAGWLWLEESSSPIVMHAVERSHFPSVEAFAFTLDMLPLAVQDGVLTVRALGRQDTVSLPFRSKEPPTIGSSRIDFEAPLPFRSPFISADADGQMITVTSGSDRHIIDLR